MPDLNFYVSIFISLSYASIGSKGVLSNSDRGCEKAIPAFFPACFTEGAVQKSLLWITVRPLPGRLWNVCLQLIRSHGLQWASMCLCCAEQGLKQEHAANFSQQQSLEQNFIQTNKITITKKQNHPKYVWKPETFTYSFLDIVCSLLHIHEQFPSNTCIDQGERTSWRESHL